MLGEKGEEGLQESQKKYMEKLMFEISSVIIV